MWVRVRGVYLHKGKALEVESFGDLPELYTDGFDAEGVWEQVRLRVRSVCLY